MKSLEYMSTNTKRKKGLKMLKGQLESVYRRRTDNGQKKKGQKGKQNTTQKESSNTNPTKTRGWTNVLRKGTQFLLH